MTGQSMEKDSGRRADNALAEDRNGANQPSPGASCFDSLLSIISLVELNPP